MTIETKYNIGDEVWIMRDNIAMSSIVTGIFASRVAKFYDCPAQRIVEKVGYIIEDGDTFSERLLFPTKEKLLKSL